MIYSAPTGTREHEGTSEKLRHRMRQGSGRKRIVGFVFPLQHRNRFDMRRVREHVDGLDPGREIAVAGGEGEVSCQRAGVAGDVDCAFRPEKEPTR